MTAIPQDILRKGLYALGEAYGRKIDEDTVKLWAHATRELSTEQFRFGVDVVIRTPRGFFPPPGVVIEAAYGAPLPQRKLPPIREDGQFWASGGQARHVQETVQRNPKRETEGTFAYIRRIAVLSGLVVPDKGESVEGPMIPIGVDRTNRREEDVRLPYKDPEDIDRGDDPDAY